MLIHRSPHCQDVIQEQGSTDPSPSLSHMLSLRTKAYRAGSLCPTELPPRQFLKVYLHLSSPKRQSPDSKRRSFYPPPHLLPRHCPRHFYASPKELKDPIYYETEDENFIGKYDMRRSKDHCINIRRKLYLRLKNMFL